MGLFDNFRKRNKERKERNIRRETLRRAAAGDTSDYVKKQMQKYGTSLEDFKANPEKGFVEYEDFTNILGDENTYLYKPVADWIEGDVSQTKS